MENLLFPQPYLPEGSKGPAVRFLQFLLLAMGFNSKIIPDGDYGHETATGVSQLQATIGAVEDGQFGPETREKLLLLYGIDVNLIEAGAFLGETTIPG